MDDKDLQGEGNYDAARRYREKTERFIKDGRVDEAARNAAPRSDDEAAELDEAEAAGRDRAAEEDPLVRDDEQ